MRQRKTLHMYLILLQYTTRIYANKVHPSIYSADYGANHLKIFHNYNLQEIRKVYLKKLILKRKYCFQGLKMLLMQSLYKLSSQTNFKLILIFLLKIDWISNHSFGFYYGRLNLLQSIHKPDLNNSIQKFLFEI